MESCDTRRLVLSPALLRDLAEHNPFGQRVTPEEVEAWAERIWPAFRLRRYKNRELALRKWWARASLGELVLARAQLALREDLALHEQEEKLRADTRASALSPSVAASLFGTR